MSAKRFKLTKTAKVLLMLLFVAIIGGGIFAGIKTGVHQNEDGGNQNREHVAEEG